MARFMQEMQRIEVIVRKDDGASSIAGANDKEAENAGTNADTQAQGGNGEATTNGRSKHFWRVNTTKVLAAGMTAGRLQVNYYINGLGYKHGDTALQEAAQRRYEVLDEMANMASSVGMGSTYGSVGGGWGALIGAVVGMGVNAYSLTKKYQGKEREYNMKMFKEENAISYKRARANLSLTTGRLR